MSQSNIFRILVLAELLSLPALILLEYFFPIQLPTNFQNELASYKASHGHEHSILLYLLIANLPLRIIASIGLLYLKNWSRWLYLFCCVFAYVIGSLSEPTVQVNLAFVDSAIALGYALSGAVLSLAFYGKLITSHRKNEQSNV